MQGSCFVGFGMGPHFIADIYKAGPIASNLLTLNYVSMLLILSYQSDVPTYAQNL